MTIPRGAVLILVASLSCAPGFTAADDEGTSPQQTEEKKDEKKPETLQPTPKDSAKDMQDKLKKDPDAKLTEDDLSKVPGLAEAVQSGKPENVIQALEGADRSDVKAILDHFGMDPPEGWHVVSKDEQQGTTEGTGQKPPPKPGASPTDQPVANLKERVPGPSSEIGAVPKPGEKKAEAPAPPPLGKQEMKDLMASLGKTIRAGGGEEGVRQALADAMKERWGNLSEKDQKFLTQSIMSLTKSPNHAPDFGTVQNMMSLLNKEPGAASAMRGFWESTQGQQQLFSDEMGRLAGNIKVTNDNNRCVAAAASETSLNGEGSAKDRLQWLTDLRTKGEATLPGGGTINAPPGARNMDADVMLQEALLKKGWGMTEMLKQVTGGDVQRLVDPNLRSVLFDHFTQGEWLRGSNMLPTVAAAIERGDTVIVGTQGADVSKYTTTPSIGDRIAAGFSPEKHQVRVTELIRDESGTVTGARVSDGNKEYMAPVFQYFTNEIHIIPRQQR